MAEGTRYGSFFSVVFLILEFASGMIDYCRNNTFDRPSNSEFLHFSKENSDDEFGIYNKFKCLHCCSHGYRSLEWFKDGQPYPWSTNVSTLIIYPESGNQTIYSQQLSLDDSGKYWCIVRNDTTSLRHEVSLKVSGPSISLGWPKTTYRPRDQKAACGESARFYCEAFVGTIDLPDFQSEILWERYDSNQSFINGVTIVQENIFREEKRVIGSYLSFTSVSQEDYGQYKCKVKNLGDQVVELSAWLKRKGEDESTEVPVYSSRKVPHVIHDFYVTAILFVLTAVMSTLTFLHFGPYIRLMGKRIFHASSPLDDGKKNLLIVYHETDVGDSLSVLLPLLKTRNQFSCALHPIQSRSQIGEEELKAKANSYRGLLVVMTPELLGGSWSCESLHSTIQSLLNVHFTVICFFEQGLPTSTEANRSLLQDALARIHYVDGAAERFWASKSTWTRLKSSWRRHRRATTVGSLQELV